MEAREYRINAVLFRHAAGHILGVNVTDMKCLSLIFFNSLATPSEIARYTGLSSGSTTAMLDRLEKSGLIERQPNPNDRRSAYIVIAKEAGQKLDQLFASARKAQDSMASTYTEAELELLANFFKRSATMWEEERKKLQDLKSSRTVKRRPK